jgi:hypothetical protein
VSEAQPQIGDTRPAPEAEGAAEDPEPEERVDRFRPLREAYERSQVRAASLEHLAVENAALKRTIGLITAGVDPASTLGQTIATAAAAAGVSDPEQVAALARVLRAETNGGTRRRRD